MYAPNLCTAQIAVHMLEIFCFFFWGTVANYLNVGDVVDDGSDEDCNCIIGNDDVDQNPQCCHLVVIWQPINGPFKVHF